MYALVWEFRVSGEHDVAFRQAYGPDGEWARLFRRGAGYLGTDLLEGESEGGERRYLTEKGLSPPQAGVSESGQ
jgi:hypothetical protein